MKKNIYPKKIIAMSANDHAKNILSPLDKNLITTMDNNGLIVQEINLLILSYMRCNICRDVKTPEPCSNCSAPVRMCGKCWDDGLWTWLLNNQTTCNKCSPDTQHNHPPVTIKLKI
jgi:hypothetical protein